MEGLPSPPLPAADSPSSRGDVPMALAGGLVLWLLTSLVTAARFTTLGSGAGSGQSFLVEMWRWNLLQSAMPFACLTLAGAGALELCRRTSGPAQAGAKLAAGALFALLGMHAVHAYCAWTSAMRPESTALYELWRWMLRGYSTAWLAFGAGLLVAGWRSHAVRWMTAPLLIATLLAHPFELYRNELYQLLGGDGSRAGSVLLRCLFDLVWVGMAIFTVALAAPRRDGSDGWPRVARALDRASNALYARLALSVFASLLTLMVLLSRGQASATVQILGGLWVPLGAALAVLVAMSGILGAAGLTVPGAPRRLLYTAAALTVAVTALATTQAYILYRGGDRDDLRAMASSMPMLLPVLSFLAVSLLSLGLYRLAELTPSLPAREQAWRSRNTVLFGSAVALAAPFLARLSIPTTWHAHIFWTLVAAIASLLAQASLAQLCRVLASELRERGELPSATIVQR